MKRMKLVGWLLCLAGLLLVAACASDDGSGSGTLQVALTDNVEHNFSEVVIAIEEVRVAPAGEEELNDEDLPLVVAFDEPLVVDVLTLAYFQEILGEAILPAGEYSQLRLVLAENADPLNPANYVVFADDPDQLPVAVDTPSAQQSGLKINAEFDLAADEVVTISLDFDPSRAIVQSGQSGKWIFKPTGIRAVEIETFTPVYGALAGTVVYEEVQDGVTVQLPLEGAKVVTVPENGTEEAASSLVAPEDGSFRLILPPGAYELQVTADGFEDYSTLPTVFEVVEELDTDAGALVIPPATL